MTINTRMPDVKGVVFDLGGVVIDWNPMYLYRKVFDGDEIKAANFLQTICTAEWNGQQDAGRDLLQATEERVARFPQWEREIRAYYGRWIEMIGGAIPGTTELIEEIKASGLHVFALSNWHCETFSRVRYNYRAFDLFEHIVLSGEYGCIKPDRNLYEIAFKCYGIPAENLVFVDDSPANVAGSIAAGMPALHFTGADKFRRDLLDLGVMLAQAG